MYSMQACAIFFIHWFLWRDQGEIGERRKGFPKDHNQRDERGGRAHLTLSFSALRGMGFSSDTCSRRNTEGPNWSGGAILTRIPSNKNGYKREHIATEPPLIW